LKKGFNVNITFFEESSGDKIAINAPIGKSLLDVALEHNLDIEGL
jgi:hypothetical protein